MLTKYFLTRFQPHIIGVVATLGSAHSDLPGNFYRHWGDPSMMIMMIMMVMMRRRLIKILLLMKCTPLLSWLMVRNNLSLMMIIDDINVFSCSIYCLRYVLMLLVLFSPLPPLIFIDAWWYYARSCISCIPCLWKRCLLLLYFFLRQWCSLLLYYFLLTKTIFSLVDNLLFQICSNAVTANILLPGWRETIYLHFLIIVINHIRYFELVSSYSSHDFLWFFFSPRRLGGLSEPQPTLPHVARCGDYNQYLDADNDCDYR